MHTAGSQAPLFDLEVERVRRRSPVDVAKDEVDARVILDSIWIRVRDAIAGAITRTAWRQRNKRVALDLARAGATMPQILEAHAGASKRMGAVVYSLQIVQDELAKMGARSVAGAGAVKVADDAAIERLR